MHLTSIVYQEGSLVYLFKTSHVANSETQELNSTIKCIVVQSIYLIVEGELFLNYGSKFHVNKLFTYIQFS